MTLTYNIRFLQQLVFKKVRKLGKVFLYSIQALILFL